MMLVHTGFKQDTSRIEAGYKHPIKGRAGGFT
jgi:hypothetical protein